MMQLYTGIHHDIVSAAPVLFTGEGRILTHFSHSVEQSKFTSSHCDGMSTTDSNKKVLKNLLTRTAGLRCLKFDM